MSAPDTLAIDPKRGRDWDAVAAVVATLVGLLALLVSGYTAYVQRQQVRAQVWPYLLVGWSGNERSFVVLNKGTGPAIVRSVQVWVDNRPQPDWDHVLSALGTPDPDAGTSTVSNNVLSPGETVKMITMDQGTYRRFFGAAHSRLGWEVCFCSTLGDCWIHSKRVPGQRFKAEPSSCPAVPAAQAFKD